MSVDLGPADPRCKVTAGKVDLAKVQPFLFDMHSRGYWKLGERFSGAWQVGKELKDKH
jgi:hypothetical protein